MFGRGRPWGWALAGIDGRTHHAQPRKCSQQHRSAHEHRIGSMRCHEWSSFSICSRTRSLPALAVPVFWNAKQCLHMRLRCLENSDFCQCVLHCVHTWRSIGDRCCCVCVACGRARTDSNEHLCMYVLCTRMCVVYVYMLAPLFHRSGNCVVSGRA